MRENPRLANDDRFSANPGEAEQSVKLLPAARQRLNIMILVQRLHGRASTSKFSRIDKQLHLSLARL